MKKLIVVQQDDKYFIGVGFLKNHSNGLYSCVYNYDDLNKSNHLKDATGLGYKMLRRIFRNNHVEKTKWYFNTKKEAEQCIIDLDPYMLIKFLTKE